MRLAHWAVNAPFRPLLLAVLTSSFILPAQAADLVTIARDALQNDATLAAARAQLLAAEAGTDVERGALLPQVNTDASVSNTRIYSRQLFNFGGNSIGASSFGTDNNYSSTRLNLDASQALFDATSSARLNRARRQLDQQTLSLEVTRQQLLFDVSEAYFEILRAYDILEARRAQEAAIGRQFEQARERFNVGLIAITEVHEAEASFDLARAQRIAGNLFLHKTIVRFVFVERPNNVVAIDPSVLAIEIGFRAVGLRPTDHIQPMLSHPLAVVR